MAKMIISVIACVALSFGAIVAWCCYHDLLAVCLFVLAGLPSCYFEQGRMEYKESRHV